MHLCLKWDFKFIFAWLHLTPFSPYMHSLYRGSCALWISRQKAFELWAVWLNEKHSVSAELQTSHAEKLHQNCINCKIETTRNYPCIGYVRSNHIKIGSAMSLGCLNMLLGTQGWAMMNKADNKTYAEECPIDPNESKWTTFGKDNGWIIKAGTKQAALRSWN